MTRHRTKAPKNSSFRYRIGIDEVGRGPLAGPITVSAVLIPSRFAVARPRSLPVRDSKRLSARRREQWLALLRRTPSISYAVASVSPRYVDRKGIVAAAGKAVDAAFSGMVRKSGSKARHASIILDAGLSISPKTLARHGISAIPRSFVRGDERFPEVALASIVAKVARDRLMKRIDSAYPAYGFAAHKGYGTKAHYAALRRHGPSRIHRLTFLRGLPRCSRLRKGGNPAFA